MQIIVTTMSFDNYGAAFDFLIPSMADAMERLINQLIVLEDPPININNLNAIHFTDKYPEELFEFQKTIGHHAHATHNKLGDGHAQVVYVAEGQGAQELQGYHIFFSKLIPMAVMVGQYAEDNSSLFDTEYLKKVKLEKNRYIRLMRHELAHVEDENNQKNWTWLETAFQGNTLISVLRVNAARLWEEYYACRRSDFYYDLDGTVDELGSLLHSLDKAEEEVCDLRWKYNNGHITLDEFVCLLYEYVRLAFIYCCYFMGYNDRAYEVLVDKLNPDLYPSRFYPFMGQMWGILRTMADSYPDWSSPEIYDELADIILKCLEQFEVYPEDTDCGLYYDIPLKKLTTRSKETS